jgi:glycine cleavage system protein P-like pyridoxal-binding family
MENKYDFPTDLMIIFTGHCTMKYSATISTFSFSFCHYLEKHRHRKKNYL